MLHELVDRLHGVVARKLLQIMRGFGPSAWIAALAFLKLCHFLCFDAVSRATPNTHPDPLFA
jgi:hypothetical protein